jgi:hypothetical protein
MRWCLVVGWFVLLIGWNLPPGWSAVADGDKPRLFMAVLHGMATPTSILVSVGVVALILFVKVDPY